MARRHVCTAVKQVSQLSTVSQTHQTPFLCAGRALATAESTVARRSLRTAASRQRASVVDDRPHSSPPAIKAEDEDIEEIIPLGSESPVTPPTKSIVDELNHDPSLRLPRSVQALYLRPLRRKAEYGIPCCDLQLRSYEVRNVEFFADFAMRAAYYLNLPASGPVPLPRIVQRWTVPRSNFVHKKSQQNFERITLRRLIQIQDAHEDSVRLWLAFLRKHAYAGVGMKANIWRNSSLDVSGDLDKQLDRFAPLLDPIWDQLARRKGTEDSTDTVELLSDEKYRAYTKLERPVPRYPR